MSLPDGADPAGVAVSRVLDAVEELAREVGPVTGTWETRKRVAAARDAVTRAWPSHSMVDGPEGDGWSSLAEPFGEAS